MAEKITLKRCLLFWIAPMSLLVLSAAPLGAEAQIYGLLGTGKADTDLDQVELDFGNDFQVGGGFNWLGGEGFRAGLGVEVNYFTGSDQFEDIDLDIDSTITSLNFVIESAGPIRPFVSAGVGLGHNDLSSRNTFDPEIRFDGEEFSFAYTVGGGLKAILGEVFLLGADFHYFRIQTDPEPIRLYRAAGLFGVKF